MGRVIEMIDERIEAYIADDGQACELAPGTEPPGGGSVFIMEPIPYQIALQFGRRGEEAAEAAQLEVARCIKGWRGVQRRGVEVPFSPDLLTNGQVPVTVLSALGTFLVKRAMPVLEEGRKNALSGSGPATKPCGGTTTPDHPTA